VGDDNDETDEDDAVREDEMVSTNSPDINVNRGEEFPLILSPQLKLHPFPLEALPLG